MKKETLDFESALKKLEAIVQKLENPEVPLQEGFALYEEGMNLTGQMKKELNEIEKKVKILQKGAKGDLQEADFEPSEND
ncbi:MAG: exodeoxyribonuclease VII small subunit [Acidobacteria bacterium]|nr:exodeoxyribonuclease VII small subunit [Acidobacteriota bacterium]MBU4306454.1 exodeoxyribonuclease VII small subunit [Acidobacteriota bacterium]MBU4404169.1 exodeoxyribonuclease VII small subunit [Acidobacteriota bacterium]MCG2812461.1 exodeoxyribonuclease VII small subunit [Candidatus Aminicenantes bacterium]